VSETRTEAGAQRRLKLRERLLEAARAAINARGLSGLKARDLAAETGCALGAIYTAFDDLDELILRVNVLGAALDAALAKLRADGTLEQVLDRWITVRKVSIGAPELAPAEAAK